MRFLALRFGVYEGVVREIPQQRQKSASGASSRMRNMEFTESP
jgi:hypothetical protein